MVLKILLFVLVLALLACQSPSPKVCESHQHPFKMDTCQLRQGDNQKLHLFWQDNQGQTLMTFEKLHQFVARTKPNQRLIFAMNAGMYDKAFAPIGYTVIDKINVMPPNLQAGDGNFYLKPNGVFYWNQDGFFVEETQKFTQNLARLSVDFATQSGPMLVMEGQIHPAFDINSQSLKIRNGVGVNCHNQSTRFIISREPVNFYQFASAFRDNFGCQNALFLDGGVASALYSDDLDKNDKIKMAVMIGFLN